MIGKKALETNPISMTKVKKILEDFSGKFELNYEQDLTLEHVNKFSELSLEDSEKLIDELENVVKRKYAIKIADILPEDLSDLRLLFAKERIPIKKENMEEILDILNKYR
ncbi:MAG: RNA polymerase Rpb4 family protein [Methanobrevibacter sp.]|jgi:DNA-directed RNA polymerase subunit F|nr:RNA polymerase Rpb4 family protein [Candidatus Methanovirga aequatorialis]